AGEHDNVPASLSKHMVTDLLRGECGFDGVALTDDLTMGAAVTAAGSLARAACLALAAGHDLLLVCAAPEQIAEVMTTLVKQCSPETHAARVEPSLERLRRLSHAWSKP